MDVVFKVLEMPTHEMVDGLWCRMKLRSEEDRIKHANAKGYKDRVRDGCSPYPRRS